MPVCQKFDFELGDLTLQFNYVSSETVGELTGQEDWIQLTPRPEPGTNLVKGKDGRKFRVSSEAVDAFNTRKQEIFIDIEHEAASGKSKEVIGWVSKLEQRNGGEVWGLAKWNKLGKDVLENKSYRSISPVVKPTEESYLRLKTKEQDFFDVDTFTSVAVTNRPNLHLRSLHTEQNIMRNDLVEMLQMHTDCSDGDILTAVQTLKQSSVNIEKLVPRADYDLLLNQLKSLELNLKAVREQQHTEKVNKAIDQALQSGKIPPASAQYHRECCSTDEGLERFIRFVDAAPQVISMHSQFEGREEPVFDMDSLTSHQEEVSSNFNIDKDIFKAQRKKLKEEGKI